MTANERIRICFIQRFGLLLEIWTEVPIFGGLESVHRLSSADIDHIY